MAIAVVLLITLTVGGGLLGSMSQQNANQAILTAQNAQAYYAAQAGVQEAIATRMLPRSNYLNFDSNPDSADGIPYFLKAYYATSGRISLDLSNDNRVIAKYRYMVLGGDSARMSRNQYFPATAPNTEDPYLLSVNKIPTSSPFIVVSEGIICHADAQIGKALVNKFEGAGASKLLDGACVAGSRRDQVIVVAQVNLQNPDGVTPDKIVGQQVFKNPQKIKLPAGTFVPGYGWMDANSEINFDTMWRANHQANNTGDKNPLTLKKIVVYNFTENQVIRDCDVNGPNTTSCGGIINNIPREALAFRLYFNGPFDFRSISPRTNLRDNSLQDCKGANAANCHVRIMRNNRAFPANIVLPLYPGGTQVIVLPPLKAYSSNETFTLNVDTTQMRSFNGERGNVDYRIRFRASN